VTCLSSLRRWLHFKEKAEETQLKKLDALQAQISRDFDALSTDLETPGKMSWLNQDSNYKKSICEVIDFKLVHMSKLVRELSALDMRYLEHPLTTDLHVAAREGRTKTVAALLSFGADADAKDKDGFTALMLACVESAANMSEEQLSVEGAEHDVVDVLLEDLMSLESTFYHSVENVTARAQSTREKEAAAALLTEATKNAAALDVQDTKYKRSALHYASSSGLESIVAKLLSLGADVALKDKDGFTALMLACVEKKEEAAALLTDATKNAAALDVQDTKYKRSALYYASSSGLESIVAKLLSLGADVALKDECGKTALDVATNDEVKAALRQHGARYSLFYAAEEGILELVADLIKEGADVNERDQESRTALHWAAIKGHEALAQGPAPAGRRGGHQRDRRGRADAALLHRRGQQARGCQGAVGERGPSQCARQ